MTVFEEKSIGKAILRLGLPAMLAQLATLIYNTADTYFVSLTKNADQIAAVTLSTPILLICQRQFEIVRKRRRNFVVFRRQGGDKIKRFLAQKECSQFAASGA